MNRLKVPIIGVTGPDEGGWPAWTLTRLAVRRAGGRAKRITPSRPCSIEEVDGLIIGGGADVDPALYNAEKIIPQIKRERRRLHRMLFKFAIGVLVWLLRRTFSSPWHQHGDRERDRLESGLIRDAIARKMPMLGICRGMQLINVCYGGTLHQDITEFYEESPKLRTILPKKKIEIDPCSKLHGYYGKSLLRVNSLHNQSVHDLGRDLRVSAKEPNGVIQAIESRNDEFVVGVQWHPEFLPQEPLQQKLFQELVHRSRECAKTRQSHAAPRAEYNVRTSSPTQ